MFKSRYNNLLLSITMLLVLSAADAENVGIVAREGNRFTLDGYAFYYAGVNNYYQMVYAADPGLLYAVDEVIEEAAAMGMTVLRTWAFNDGADQWNALQVRPGVYQEYVFAGLDYVLYKADQEGIRLILPLVNNWDDYGGMNRYVTWADSAYTLGCAGFVQVNGTHFEVNGRTYYFVGMNYWYGLNLASNGSGGDRQRLNRELDSLRAIGVTNLRVMAGSEGPDTEPWRMVPSLQTSPGVYNPDVLDGLDYLVYAMKERGIRAVMCLNNFWQWSGGMAQYVNWNGGGPIPYPPPEPGGNWDEFQDYASDFYSNAGAKQDFRDHINFIINRINPYTGVAYRDETAIMSWELGNEPRGWHNNTSDFNTWIDSTAAYIKSLDPNHLVTTGCEGDTPWPDWNGLDFGENQDGPDIDYTTIHIWPQNWGWYDPADPSGTYAAAEANARSYFNSHEAEAAVMGKPLVLEEFGLARDGGSFDPNSATTWRDTFLGAMYDEIYTSASAGGPAGGSSVWAWAGEGRPSTPYGGYWNPGDPWIGDPPHEQQGWYSIYDADTTTQAVITAHSLQMRTLLSAGGHDDFYTDDLCRQWYKDHVAAVVGRVNTFNGRVYGEDPTVFAWELANEPECTSDPSGNTLQGWIEEMSSYLKSLDSLHMVTTGSEGFYGSSGPAHNPSGWMGTKGVDFIRNHQPESVDFACFHAWPDWWGMDLNASINWVSDHISDTDLLLGKPVILEEYGKWQPISTRNQFFQGWLDEIYSEARAGNSAAGSNLWILYNDDYPDYDGFGVYYPAHASTIQILEAHADSMNQLSGAFGVEQHLFSPGWHMISLPLIPENTSVASIFGDDITGAYFVYTYSQAGGYSTVDTVAHGYGYWFALDDDSATVDLSGVPARDTVFVPLSINWNIIGAALTAPIALSQLLFSDGIVTFSFSEAVSAGWLSPAFYAYSNPLGGYVTADTLEPWGGYWLQSLREDLQVITVPASGDRGAIPAGEVPADDEEDWFVSIILTQGGISDHLAGLGVFYEATDEYDPWYDLPAPPTPPGGEFVRLTFSHPEWQSPVGDLFCRDVRSPFGSDTAKTWNGIMEASQAGSTTVQFADIVQILPAGYSATAEIDTLMINLLETPSYTFFYTDPCSIAVTVSDILPAIEDLTIAVAGDDIVLDWSDVSAASTYYIYKSNLPYFTTAGMTPYDSTAVSIYIDVGAVAGDPGFYRITYVINE